MWIPIVSLLLIAFLVRCAAKREHKARAVRRLREASTTPLDGAAKVARGGYADFSHFDEDQMLRNRSERWDA